MPIGAINIKPNTNGSGSGGDFFDLKENGDQVIATIIQDPMVVPVHKLNDPDKEKYKWGRKFPCGGPDLNACPVCDGNGTYAEREKDTRTKIYLPVYVHMFKGAKDKEWTEIKEMKCMSGDGVFQDGFTEFLDTQATFGAKVYGVPLLVKRIGEAPKNTYPFTALPGESAVKYPVPKDVEPLDTEALALGWIRKEWEEMGYSPFGNDAPSAAAAAASSNAPDPFDDLPG